MKKSYKYRIYPNKEQQEKISQFFGCSRKMYNLLLNWWVSAYKEYKTNGTPIGTLPQPTFYKKQEEYSYLKDCDAVALATSRINLKSALDNYFKSKKDKRKGKKVHFPKFKKKGKCRDSYCTFNNSNCIKVTDGYISLPKIGKVKVLSSQYMSHVQSQSTITCHSLVRLQMKPLLLMYLISIILTLWGWTCLFLSSLFHQTKMTIRKPSMSDFSERTRRDLLVFAETYPRRNS